jgi:hypothetical protein
MEEGFECLLFLPPYLRESTCGIEAGSHVFGIVDDVTGLGVAVYGVDGADFGYYYNADIQIKKSLTVKDDVKSTDGDVLAGAISLKNHTHAITASTFTGTIDPTTGAASGTISGNTEIPS